MWIELNTEQLTQRLSTVVLIDSLGPPYYGNAHLPGAINIPPHEVTRLAPVRLPDKSARIVVYGNGSSSNASIVLRQLSRLGYHHLAHYIDGTEGWIEAGLPIE